MVGVAAIIAQELGIIAARDDSKIDVAVVVEVSSGHAASRDGAHEVRAKLIGNFVKFPMPEIAEHQLGFFVGHFGMVKANVVEHGAVHLADVRPAIVIVVEEFHGEAAQENCFIADARGESVIVKRLVVIIVIEPVKLEIQMGNVDIKPAVAIQIGSVNAHARFVLAVFAGRDAGAERNILESSVMLVDEKKIRPGVVGYRDVGPAVVVKIRQDKAHALGLRNSHAGFFAHIRERSVVIVVIELDFLSLVIIRVTVRAISGPMLAAPDIILGSPVNIVEHDQVEITVLVVIKPARAGGPATFVGHAGLLRDVGKRSVAVVVIEDGAPVAGDIEIRIAVVVKVTHGHPLAVKTLGAHSGFFRDVGKSAVAIVVIKSGAQRLGR